jgi:hypothetical protein
MNRATPFLAAASLVALLLGLLTGNAWAGADCRARMPAPNVAAWQQYVMVAALTCRAVARNEFTASGLGKASISSHRSLRDPQYCLIAMTAFFASRDRNAPQLASPPDGISCAAGADSRTAVARPRAALQREALLVGR